MRLSRHATPGERQGAASGESARGNSSPTRKLVSSRFVIASRPCRRCRYCTRAMNRVRREVSHQSPLTPTLSHKWERELGPLAPLSGRGLG